jgi:hypothetical protein
MAEGTMRAEELLLKLRALNSMPALSRKNVEEFGFLENEIEALKQLLARGIFKELTVDQVNELSDLVDGLRSKLRRAS